MDQRYVLIKWRFYKNYNEERHEGYFLEVNVQYREIFHNIHYDLSFLPDRMKLEKVKKLVANLYDNTAYIILIRNLRQALNQGLNFEKFYRVIKFNWKAWLKQYVDMNTKLRKKKKKIVLKNIFSNWSITQFLEKLWKILNL